MIAGPMSLHVGPAFASALDRASEPAPRGSPVARQHARDESAPAFLRVVVAHPLVTPYADALVQILY